jgi:GTPase SAR1 family protein
VSEFLFGERYFATRERLSAVMSGIADLATETSTDIGERLPLAEIEAGLGTPFLFVICGEVNAGKSTLINALFGRDLCRVNILPETDRVLWYKFGQPARDVEVTPLLEERYRPISFLRDFNLVDTPGTNSIVQGHQDITERFLPAAELILFVFPVTNPWGAATWDFISRIPAELLERVAFVIQQADQRDPLDLQVILGHMADLSMKRIGRTPPIFAVSGKLACEAKRSSPHSQELLKKSGCTALEDFITRSVCQSPSRRSSLETWRSQCAAALRHVEDRIEDQTRGINSQSRFIERVEREIDAIRETFVTRLPSHLAGVAQVFETEAIWVTRLLHKRLRAFPSICRLFSGDRTGPEMEAVFIERLQTAVEAVAEKDGGEVLDACIDHWDDLGERVKTEMGIDLKTAEPIEETLAAARTRFISRLGRAARQGIGSLKVRNQLDKELRRRNLALKSFIFVTLMLTIAGATCGALSVPWVPYILLGIAMVFLAGGILTAWATRKSITREFQHRLLDTCGAFASTLHFDYEEALRVVFRDYTCSLDNVRTHLAREKLAIEPRLKRWQDLFLTLKAIEQDL